jgi:hypothetical protein
MKAIASVASAIWQFAVAFIVTALAVVVFGKVKPDDE